jgi:hypothetical protein
MRAFTFFLSVVLLLVSTSARATEPPTTAAIEPATSGPSATAPIAPIDAPALVPARPTRRWYGWQTLLVDAAAFGIATTTDINVDYLSQPTGVAVVGLYTLGGPGVHLAHGNVGRAIGSFALRLGLPAAGWVIGSAGGNDVGSAITGVLLAASGYLAAVAIDASVLSWDIRDAPRDAARPTPRRLTVAPSVGVTPRGGSIGLIGAF